MPWKVQFITKGATLHFHTLDAATETVASNDPRIQESLLRQAQASRDRRPAPAAASPPATSTPPALNRIRAFTLDDHSPAIDCPARNMAPGALNGPIIDLCGTDDDEARIVPRARPNTLSVANVAKRRTGEPAKKSLGNRHSLDASLMNGNQARQRASLSAGGAARQISHSNLANVHENHVRRNADLKSNHSKQGRLNGVANGDRRSTVAVGFDHVSGPNSPTSDGTSRNKRSHDAARDGDDVYSHPKRRKIGLTNESDGNESTYRRKQANGMSPQEPIDLATYKTRPVDNYIDLLSDEEVAVHSKPRASRIATSRWGESWLSTVLAKFPDTAARFQTLAGMPRRMQSAVLETSRLDLPLDIVLAEWERARVQRNDLGYRAERKSAGRPVKTAFGPSLETADILEALGVLKTQVEPRTNANGDAELAPSNASTKQSTTSEKSNDRGTSWSSMIANFIDGKIKKTVSSNPDRNQSPQVSTRIEKDTAMPDRSSARSENGPQKRSVEVGGNIFSKLSDLQARLSDSGQKETNALDRNGLRSRSGTPDRSNDTTEDHSEEVFPDTDMDGHAAPNGTNHSEKSEEDQGYVSHESNNRPMVLGRLNQSNLITVTSASSTTENNEPRELPATPDTGSSEIKVNVPIKDSNEMDVSISKKSKNDASATNNELLAKSPIRSPNVESPREKRTPKQSNKALGKDFVSGATQLASKSAPKNANSEQTDAIPTQEPDAEDDMLFDNPQAKLASLSLSHKTERTLGKQLSKLRTDTEQSTISILKHNRLNIKKPTMRDMQTTNNAHSKADEPYDFGGFHPLQVKTGPRFTGSRNSKAFLRELTASAGTKSSTKLSCLAPLITFETEDTMPSYAHYVTVDHNFLARNEKTMHYWPYFGDDVDNDKVENLREPYSFDIETRSAKITRLLQAQHMESYVENTLRNMNITWDHILAFFLEHDPDVGQDGDARQALRIRESFRGDDFVRTAERTAHVLSSLQTCTPEHIGRAASLCENFQKMAKFSLWHIARRHLFDRIPDLDIDSENVATELVCSVCLRTMCSSHGEIEEREVESRLAIEEGASDNSEQHVIDEAQDMVTTDLVNPPPINYRKRTAWTPVSDRTPHTHPDHTSKRDPRNRNYWTGYVHNAEHREPFYSCDHPGYSCDEARCTCFLKKVPCEKTCRCAKTCPRRFQGCTCKKKGKKTLCFEDDNCLCFSLGRECDADLCGPCGAHEVLDAYNRLDDNVAANACRNVSLQRGVAKETVLGKSGVHGLGLFAAEAVTPLDLVGEYKGEVITKTEADRRGAVYEHQKLSYLFSLNLGQEIDSTYYGNQIRFINHRSDGGANLYPRINLINGVHRIGLYASKKIAAGEELFFNYGPKFPDEQLGGTGADAKSSAPHVRNANLVRNEFFDVEDGRDENGHVRARKAATRGRKAAKVVKEAKPPKQRGGARAGAGRKPQKRRPVVKDDDDARDSAPEASVAPRPRSSAADRLAQYNLSGLPGDAMDVDSEEAEDSEADFEPDEDSDDNVSEESDAENSQSDQEDDDEDDEPVRRRSTGRRTSTRGPGRRRQ